MAGAAGTSAGHRFAPVLLLLLGLGGAFGLGRAWRARTPDLSAFEDRIRRSAAEAAVEPALLMALVAAESGGDPEARSGAGAVGLCQLMPQTAREVAARLGLAGDPVPRLAEPALNLRLGAAYLARLLRAFDGEPAFALAAYNAGPTPVRRWRRRAPGRAPRDVIRKEAFPETRAFVSRALALRDRYAAR